MSLGKLEYLDDICNSEVAMIQAVLASNEMKECCVSIAPKFTVITGRYNVDALEHVKKTAHTQVSAITIDYGASKNDFLVRMCIGSKGAVKIGYAGYRLSLTTTESPSNSTTVYNTNDTHIVMAGCVYLLADILDILFASVESYIENQEDKEVVLPIISNNTFVWDL